jgi:hypothetical protein
LRGRSARAPDAADRPIGKEKSLQPLIHHPKIGSGDGHGHALFFEEGRMKEKDETAFLFILHPSSFILPV